MLLVVLVFASLIIYQEQGVFAIAVLYALSAPAIKGVKSLFGGSKKAEEGK